MRIFKLSFLLVLLAFAACQNPEEPKFVKMKNVRVDDIKKGRMVLIADAVYFNPNAVGVTLTKTDLNLEINSEKVGQINQIQNVKIPAKSEFTVPLRIDASSKMLSDNWLSNAISILGNKEIEVKYTGTSTIEVAKIPIQIPVNFSEKIKIKL